MIVQGFWQLDNIKISPASRILDSSMVSNVTIVLHLSDYFDCNILQTCMYVLYIYLIGVHTHSNTYNLSLHKGKFEPPSMEHNQFQLMQCIQFLGTI